MSDPWLTTHIGDCREVLATLPAESVHCVVTSPPYWGLRDYGTATWVGGDADCHHRVPATGSTQNKGNNNRDGAPFASLCGLCGAIRQDRQLGLERTPDEYVAAMVGVFREVKRVLRDDGTVWLNLGDSYAATTSSNGGYSDKSTLAGFTSPDTKGGIANEMGNRHHLLSGLKPKDMVGIPWRVAFALQADGWYLRSDIIWSKPNPMPESVTDRPTKSHEYLFLLSKSARYFYDAEAVQEPQAEESIRAYQRAKASLREPRGTRSDMRDRRVLLPVAPVSPNAAWSDPEKLDRLLSRGRNLRSVWTIATQPYRGVHFATFPEALVEPCIKAGCPPQTCVECGAPWERVVERETMGRRDYGGDRYVDLNNGRAGDVATTTTIGWEPTCAHDAPTVPGTVLDPFAGTGTVGLVANRLSRRAILIDLNPEYLRQIVKRTQQAPLGLVG